MTITPFNATVGEDAEPLLFIPRKGRKYRNGVSVVRLSSDMKR